VFLDIPPRIPYVVQFVFLGSQAGFDIAQALPISELGAHHTEILIVATELLDFVVAAVSRNTLTYMMQGQVIDHLREDHFA
jgi:hypothetical protein